MKFASYLIAVALVCAIPQAAAPQSKDADAKKAAAAEKARVEALRAALHRHEGHSFSDGIHVSVTGYYIAINVPRKRIAEVCSTGPASLWAYLGADDIAIILDAYMRSAKKSHDDNVRSIERLVRTIGAYQLPDNKLPVEPAPPTGSAKAPMTPIPNKALAARK
jgi:hypothetical protein